MNIQEFARQLDRDDHSSRMIQALRILRSSDLEELAGPGATGGWSEWVDGETRAYAERPELRS